MNTFFLLEEVPWSPLPLVLWEGNTHPEVSGPHRKCDEVSRWVPKVCPLPAQWQHLQQAK